MKLNSEIKAITFDVGGTLLQPHPSVGHIYGRVLEELGRGRFEPEELTRRFARAWKDKKAFDYSRNHWQQLVNKTFSGLLPEAEIPFEALYDRFNSPGVWREFDDVRPLMNQLRQQGTRVGIISNWDERLRPLLAAHGNPPLDTFFHPSSVVVSHETGCTKPSPEIFLQAARALDLPPENILHVGDSQREDVDGARAVGMNAFLIHRSCSASETLTDLRHLPAILEKGWRSI